MCLFSFIGFPGKLTWRGMFEFLFRTYSSRLSHRRAMHSSEAVSWFFTFPLFLFLKENWDRPVCQPHQAAVCASAVPREVGQQCRESGEMCGMSFWLAGFRWNTPRADLSPREHKIRVPSLYGIHGNRWFPASWISRPSCSWIRPTGWRRWPEMPWCTLVCPASPSPSPSMFSPRGRTHAYPRAYE